jgi:glutamyl-tRNA reductase
MPAARRFPELGLRVGEELMPVEPIESLARIPRSRTRTRRAPMSPKSLHLENFTPRAGLLAGRAIMITGATGGLGRALSVACARAGASVILCGRNPAKLDRLYDEIEALGCPQPAIAVLDLATATAADYDSSRAP